MCFEYPSQLISYVQIQYIVKGVSDKKKALKFKCYRNKLRQNVPETDKNSRLESSRLNEVI